MSVILETTLGDIIVDLFVKERPRCCLNFLKLCKVKYYNYCLVHSVQKNFVLQTGGDASGRGSGESIFRRLYGEQASFFEAEVVPKLIHRKLGTVSMVNNGEGAHGSQFLITLSEGINYLDGVHTVFGEVGEGFDILKQINETICDDDNVPFVDIRINHTVVLDDPFDDPPGLEVPRSSPEPDMAQLESGRLGVHEIVDENEGRTAEEIEEEIEEKEAKARSQILEMVGDIPDADVAPPDNVLFVCKLNPVTSDDDLCIIFSRFGKIDSCEVIRDEKTGESLNYAFIEFEKAEDCESAYFKMDNVLIDERRIHVDFSQSVSKMKYKNKSGQRNQRYLNDKRARWRQQRQTEQQQPQGDRQKRKGPLIIIPKGRARSPKHPTTSNEDSQRERLHKHDNRKFSSDERRRPSQQDKERRRHYSSDREDRSKTRHRKSVDESEKRSKHKEKKRKHDTSDSSEEEHGVAHRHRKDRSRDMREKGKNDKSEVNRRDDKRRESSESDGERRTKKHARDNSDDEYYNRKRKKQENHKSYKKEKHRTNSEGKEYMRKDRDWKEETRRKKVERYDSSDEEKRRKHYREKRHR